MKASNRTEWSKLVKQRDGFRCRICGEEGTNAHHIYCEGYFPELRLDMDNGVTLCRKCHTLVHRGKFGAKNKGKYSIEYSFEELRKRSAPLNHDALIEHLLNADIVNEERAAKENP